MVSGELAACLLHSCDGRGSRHAGGGAAGGDVSVTRGLLQLVDLVVQHLDVDIVQGLALYR